jgi:hypothetical protein
MENNEYCIGVYEFNNKEYIAVLNNSNELKDVVTEKKFNLRELQTIKYQIPSNSFVKYLKARYKKVKSIEIFEDALKLNQTNLTDYLLPILRFFDLSYSDFISTSISKETLNKVILKLKRYWKRYIAQDVIEEYTKQIGLFTSLIDVFSFLPDEIREIKVPFWQNIVIEWYGDEIVYPLTTGINTEVLSQCNHFQFNLSECLRDFNKFNENLKTLQQNLREKICRDYKQLVTTLAHKKIKDAIETLDEELKTAQTEDDQDLITEVEMIRSMIVDLENNIDQQIEELPVDVKIITWWPELLYPAPKIEFQLTNEYYDLVHIQTYFIGNDRNV